jgi:hypothetical protein
LLNEFESIPAVEVTISSDGDIILTGIEPEIVSDVFT